MPDRFPARVTPGLPLNKVFNLSGHAYHAGWFNGEADTGDEYPYGVDGDWLGRKRYGFIYGTGENDPTLTLDQSDFVCGPNTLHTLPELAKELLAQDWRFASATGLLDADQIDFIPSTSKDFATAPYLDSGSPGAFYPSGQHYALADLTGSRRRDGRYALYNYDTGGDASALGADLAAHIGLTGTVVFVVDGTGSFGSGSTALALIRTTTAAYRAALGADGAGRVVVSKFSDTPEFDGFYTAVITGQYTGMAPATIDQLVIDLLAIDTGNGNDTNETQFEGVYLGITTARDYPGPRTVIVYTDAASVCPFPLSSASPYLRMTQRDDGLGIARHPRLSTTRNPPSSTQLTAAPRLGAAPSTYT